MCGFLGSVSIGGVVQEPHGFKGRLASLSHRGPDNIGCWVSEDGAVMFGHTRLAVHGLDATSNQPMLSDCRRYAIVFNGEIYNFRELRAQLEREGRSFVTTGDTEVLLESYIRWGNDCVVHLNGMFSFAVYDRELGKIFIARDRAGEKPFYYSKTLFGFSFSSELKALESSEKIDLSSLNFYLSLGYVPGDRCLFEGVSKLPAAHCGEFDVQSGNLKVWRYWCLPKSQVGATYTSDELILEAGSLLQDSVRMRLSADVPVGVLLSGGLDSSLVAAAAARVSSSPIQTFTIALPGSPLDEAHHARKVAEFLGTQHHVLELNKPSLDLLDGLAPLIDEPIADSSLLPAWLVFGLARKQVTVALGGDGGDELFGGYKDYTTSLSDQQKLGMCPAFVFRALASISAKLPAGVKGRNRIASLRNGPLQQLIWGRPYFDIDLRKRIFKKDAWHVLQGQENAPEEFLLSLFESGASDIDRMTRTHFGSILPDDFLVKVDRASMAHSLEVRAPMLDHRLIEFCFSKVPDKWKVKDGESRRLQRKVAEDWLPPSLDTRRKQGFSIPVNEWLRAESETQLMARMEALPEVINLDEVRSLVRGHLAGRANGGRLFALIMLDMAMRNKRA